MNSTHKRTEPFPDWMQKDLESYLAFCPAKIATLEVELADWKERYEKVRNCPHDEIEHQGGGQVIIETCTKCGYSWSC